MNAGWVWASFSRMLVLAACFCGLLIWLLRLQSVSILPAWCLGGGLLLVGLIGSLTLSAGQRVTLDAALTRLDVGWGMNQRLVSAYAGVGVWPASPLGRKLPLRLRWDRLLWPCLLALMFLASATLLPLPPPVAVAAQNRAEPPAWQRLESLLDALAEQPLIQEEGPRSLKREVAVLREKDMQTWYDPSTLEATDRLRNRTAEDAARLLQAMQNTAALLQLAAEGKEQLSSAQQRGMQQFLEQLQGQMAEGGFKLDPAALQQLQMVDLSEIAQMDLQQLQALEQQLQQNAAGMQQALMSAGLLQGFGDQPGQGGISRGGGPSALTLKDFESIAEPVVPLMLEAGSQENLQMGDLLSLRETDHEDERNDVPSQGGAVKAPGGAGEVVWEQDFLPSDVKVLKEFFK